MKLVARRIYETLSDKVMFFVLLFNFFSVCSKSGSLNVIYSMLHLTNVGLTHSVRYETILHGTVSQLHIKNGSHQGCKFDENHSINSCSIHIGESVSLTESYINIVIVTAAVVFDLCKLEQNYNKEHTLT